MSIRSKHLAACAAAALLAACGGGSDTIEPATSGAVASALRAKALRNAGVSPEEAARQLMDAAESTPQYMGYFPSHEPTQWAGPFAYRYYPGTQIYLGVVVTAAPGYAVGAIYVIGGPFGGSIESPVPQGFVTDHITPVAPPSGAGNGCFDLNLAQTPGTRLVVNYEATGSMTGSLRIETVVGGPATFEGHQALLTTASTTGSGSTAQGSATIDSTIKMYSSLAAGTADVTQYGQEFVTTAATGGYTLTTTNRTVWNPPYLDPQYTLAPGQSATHTLSGTLTSVMSGIPNLPAIPTTTLISQTATTRYAGREAVTVPAGPFDTCRFDVTTTSAAGSSSVSYWVIVGTGITVRTEEAGQTSSATSIAVNGQPL